VSIEKFLEQHLHLLLVRSLVAKVKKRVGTVRTRKRWRVVDIGGVSTLKDELISGL
jgi:hypothetical protein